MKKYFIAALFSAVAFTSNAQDEESEEQKQGWTKGGTFQLLFNQSAFQQICYINPKVS